MTIQPAPTPSALIEQPAAAAMAYIDDDHAIVVKNLADGSISVVEITHHKPEDLSYLVRIVDGIGARRRVAILGPDHLRLELEREYVALYRRPDLLVDVEDSPPQTASRLITRLEELRG